MLAETTDTAERSAGSFRGEPCGPVPGGPARTVTVKIATEMG
jgi:hypothetical protein